MRWKSLAELSTLELWAITKRTFSRGKDTSSTKLFRKRLKRPCLRLSSCGPWVSSTLWAEEVVLDWGPNRGWEGQWAIFLNFDFWKCRTRDAFQITFSQDPRGLNSKNQRMRHTRPSNSPKLAAGALVLPRTAATDMQKNEWTHDTISFFVKLGPWDHLLWCALMPLFDCWNWIRSKETSDIVSLSMQDTHLEWVITAYPTAQQWHSQRMLKTTYLLRFAGVLDIFGFEASRASFIKNESNQKQVLLGWPSGPVGLKWWTTRFRSEPFTALQTRKITEHHGTSENCYEPRQVLYYVVDINM